MPIDLAIVPVAGQGTRLLPLTKSQPKEMLPVGRKPVVQYVVEELALSNIRRLLFVTGPGKDSIENHFDVNVELVAALRAGGKEELLRELAFERQDLEYFYTRQRRQLGLGHAVLCARSFVGDQPFAVALGDSIIGLNAQSDIVRRLAQVFEDERADAVIALEEVPREEVIHYGIVDAGGSTADVMRLLNLVEKPSVQAAPSCLAVAARYVCGPVIFRHLARTRAGKHGEIQLTDAFSSLIEQGGKVLGVRLRESETRFDIGNFESFFRAFTEFALNDAQYGPGLRSWLEDRLASREGPAPNPI